MKAAFQIWKMSLTKNIALYSVKSRTSVEACVYRKKKRVCLQLDLSCFVSVMCRGNGKNTEPIAKHCPLKDTGMNLSRSQHEFKANTLTLDLD